MNIADLQLDIAVYTALYTSQVPDGTITASESSDQGRKAIVLDFLSGNVEGIYARDLGTTFSWPVQANTALYVWQPTIIPQPVTIAGQTVHPPDDSQPEKQKINIGNGYLYYDYVDTNGTPRTLVYDVAAQGWVIDEYQYPATLHVLEEGPNVNTNITGCSDGSVRELNFTGDEVATSFVMVPPFLGSDVRAQKHFGDIYIEGATNNQI